jgi:pimeloyl-ACP methyl ester carboxylesterase
MNYKIEGNGETIAFIHGISDNLQYWEFLASNLKVDYQILRVDLRGHGESELGDDEITIDLYCSDLANLLDELNIDKLNLVGFSLGGAVALDFALKYPERLSSLVLMSSFSKTDEYSEKIIVQLRNALENGFEEFYDLILPKVLCEEVIDENRKELDALREIASQTADTQAYIKAFDACLDFDCDERLSEINIPSLVLAGKHDEIFNLEAQIELQGKIRKSRLIVFDNAKHNLLVGKNNLEILEILKGFIKKESK